MSHDNQPEAVDLYVIDLENLHHIQRDVIARLYTVASAAYSDLKPAELTGNSFNYHLRHIQAQHLIRQTDTGNYELTARGRLLVDNVSLPSMKLKIRPVVGVALVLTSAEHGTLLYHSNREPLRGLVGLPFGKLRLGDSFGTTCQRMITRRHLDIGTISEVHELGLANIRYFDQSELVSHRVASVWTGKYSGPVQPDQTDHGHSFWSHQLAHEPQILKEVKLLSSWPVGQTTLEISSELPKVNSIT